MSEKNAAGHASPVSPANGLEALENSTFARLQSVMAHQVRRVLLVASLYDAFLLEEDGRLADLLGQVYKKRDLGYVPSLRRVTGGSAALELLAREPFDLVVTVQRLGDMDPFTFGAKVKEARPGTPVVLLAYNTPELERLMSADAGAGVDRIFVWQGDGKILVGIIQYVEDLLNARRDMEVAGIRNLLIVEDSVHFYSKYLPLVFEVLWEQTNRLMEESLSYSQRVLRQKARPRVQLATDFETAQALFEDFRGHWLGVISDYSFPKGGALTEGAGLEFCRWVRERDPHLPLLIQSSEAGARESAEQAGAGFLLKGSRTLLEDLRRHLLDMFGFGDLILRGADGGERERLTNLREFFTSLDHIPDDVLERAFDTGNLQRWLLARTELELARRLADPAIAGAPDAREKARLIGEAVQKERLVMHRGSVVDYTRHFHEDYSLLSRVGGGSLGGKARGLVFIDKVLAGYLPPDAFPGVQVGIPRTLILGTDVFDDFLRQNRLLDLAVNETSDTRIALAFLKASVPATVVGDLGDFIRRGHTPLAVRSSSLLEDALYQPFAGVYWTKMLPNNESSSDRRFQNLVDAVKLVWASTFFQAAKAYIESTNHRVEEEKMAVVVQEVVGMSYRERYYPHFSGVARSYNYYPVGNAKPEDGVVNVAVGLGKTIVDGGVSLRFTPAFSHILPQFGTVKDMLNNSQREFYAVNLRPAYAAAATEEDQYLSKLPLDTAEHDGALTHLCSTYSPQNDRVLDGIEMPGPRIVTFANILKNEVFPLAAITGSLLKLSEQAMNCPVEIEFAVNLDARRALPATFGFLQVRPLVVHDELVKVDLAEHPPGAALLFSRKVLGNGVIGGIRDIVYVKPDTFTAARTPRMAGEVHQINIALKGEGRPYLLIGPGRWGSSDSWLGIPVVWSQISGAKAIVEVALPDMNVEPSQGSHFFQNITSLRIAYFTLPLDSKESRVDWDWLHSLPLVKETQYLRHVRVEEPVEVQIDGRAGQGLILKKTAKTT